MSIASCSGKARYVSFQRAERAAREVRRYGEKGKGCMAYRCMRCRGFHVGHRG